MATARNTSRQSDHHQRTGALSWRFSSRDRQLRGEDERKHTQTDTKVDERSFNGPEASNSAAQKRPRAVHHFVPLILGPAPEVIERTPTDPLSGGVGLLVSGSVLEPVGPVGVVAQPCVIPTRFCRRSRKGD